MKAGGGSGAAAVWLCVLLFFLIRKKCVNGQKFQDIITLSSRNSLILQKELPEESRPSHMAKKKSA